jgi:hypothetical protein
MRRLSASYHIIIIIISITIIKAGPEPRIATPRPDSVGPPAGWPTGWLATRPLGPKPNHQNARSENEHPPENSSAIQPRIDCNRISQPASSSAASTNAPCRLSSPTCRCTHARTHARLVFFFFYLVFYLACFDSVRPASPARLSFHDAFSHRLFLAIPKPCFVPLVYPLHTKENLSGAV